ncbi:MAG TPA: peptidylprolyl isomerase [Candidatus Acidoferrales bacterium]|nr:peptidylprolyl isomerase [Candidatus Acidoferrales bacterium]
MKVIRLILAGLVILVLAMFCVRGAAAQAKAPQKAAPGASFNRALLNPAALNEKAPDTYDVKFTTTKGEFTVRVTRAWAPLGADRFYNLVKNGFYDDASLFRAVERFMVQFGISAHPAVSAAWQRAAIKDDPRKTSNTRGKITYAMAGPNTRTTQVFISYGDNSFLDSQGFSPFGEVVKGMDVVDNLYKGYGEETTSKQGEIAANGKPWLVKNFPKLDSIIKAEIAAAPAPAK